MSDSKPRYDVMYTVVFTSPKIPVVDIISELVSKLKVTKDAVWIEHHITPDTEYEWLDVEFENDPELDDATKHAEDALMDTMDAHTTLEWPCMMKHHSKPITVRRIECPNPDVCPCRSLPLKWIESGRLN